MQANKTVTINGRKYDAVTGMPVVTPKAAATTVKKPATVRPVTPAAASVHNNAPQRSKTLHRRVTKKPAPLAKRPTNSGRHMDIARSSNVTRFASHPVTSKPSAPIATPDIAHKTHPVAKRAVAKVEAKRPVLTAKPTSAKAVKDQAIAKTLATPSAKKAKQKKAKKGFTWTRTFTIITALFAVLIAGAAITYTNLPNVSVAIAAAQAGVEASYPKYVPDGYSLSQPVTFSDGSVSLSFISNSGAGEYTITQARSAWDSTAVLENVVRKEAGDNYVINQERGLTIYSYDGNAAWVNGGILYTIDSSAPLSSDHIRRIATSL